MSYKPNPRVGTKRRKKPPVPREKRITYSNRAAAKKAAIRRGGDRDG